MLGAPEVNRWWRAAAVAVGVLSLSLFTPAAIAASVDQKVPPANPVTKVVNQVDPFNAPTDALVRSDVAYGTPWRAYKVHIPEGGHTWSQIRTFASTNTSAAAYQVLWLDPAGELFAGGADIGVNTDGVLYRQNGVVVSQSLPGIGIGASGLYAGGSGDGYTTPEGDYTAIFIAATKGSFAGMFEIYGSPGVKVKRSTAGQDAFALNVTDFDNNHTRIVNGVGTVSVRDGQAALKISHRVFIWASRNVFVPGDLSYDGPDGVNHQFDIYGMVRNGDPGRYVFHLDTEADETVLVSGAGVVLP